MLTIYNFTTFRSNRLFDLTISGQYVLIYGDYEHYSGWCQWGVTNSANGGYGTDGNYWPLDGKYRRPIELWKLNSSQSVPIPLPDHKLYLTEDEQQKFFYDGRRGSQYYTVADTRCNWLLDPSSTPKYLVGIVEMGLEGLSSADSLGVLYPLSGIVLVFDQLNNPQFLHRLVLPFEGCEIIRPRLLVTKGVEQTALVIGIETDYHDPRHRVYISDLDYDFQEIQRCGLTIRNNCIYYIDQPNYIDGILEEISHLYTTNVSYDGEHFILNQFKQSVLKSIFENTDFNGDETLLCCLGNHMGYHELIGVADTRLLWKIDFWAKNCPIKCPITKICFGDVTHEILVEQDFLICSGDGHGWTWNRAKVDIDSKIVQILPSDSESDDESGFHHLFND